MPKRKTSASRASSKTPRKRQKCDSQQPTSSSIHGQSEDSRQNPSLGSGLSRALVLWRPQYHDGSDSWVPPSVHYPTKVFDFPTIASYLKSRSTEGDVHIIDVISQGRPWSISTPDFIEYEYGVRKIPCSFGLTPVEEGFIAIRDNVNADRAFEDSPSPSAAIEYCEKVLDTVNVEVDGHSELTLSLPKFFTSVTSRKVQSLLNNHLGVFDILFIDDLLCMAIEDQLTNFEALHCFKACFSSNLLTDENNFISIITKLILDEFSAGSFDNVIRLRTCFRDHIAETINAWHNGTVKIKDYATGRHVFLILGMYTEIIESSGTGHTVFGQTDQ